MRKHVIGDIVRSLLAVVGLAALVIALPIGLAAAQGWPLPSSLPSVGAIAHALSGASISDAVLLDGLACLSWVAWALLSGCVLVELMAWARGRTARRVPGAGAIQLLARHLVVSATLVVTVGRATAGPTLASSASPVVASVSPTAATSLAPVVAPAPSEASFPTCTVQPRDSLWRIAERHLGDPFRWREVYELNHGRSFADGRSLQDPDLILPGWELRLPEDAIGATAAPTPMEPVRTAAPVESSSPAPMPVPASTTTVEAPITAPPNTHDGADPRPFDDVDDDAPTVPSRLAATTLVLAGAVATITGMRRRQRRLRKSGRMIRLPGAATLRAERTVRAAADLEGADRLDLALRALASQLDDAPPIDAVRVSAREVEVLFADVANGEAGPFGGSGTRAWVLPASAPDAEIAALADRGCIAPALVGIGRSDAGDVLIDLEAGGPFTVHGTAEDTTAVLWSMVLDLATHGWADDVRVVIHGLDDRGLTALDRIEIVADLDTLLRDVEDEATARSDALAAAGMPTTWNARLASLGDGWAPTVVVLGPCVGAGDAVRAVERLRACVGVAVVVASTAEALVDRERRLLVAAGRSHVALLPLDIILEPAALPEDVLAALDDLIATAASDVPGEPLDDGQTSDVVIDLREPAVEPPSSGVMVRIMGRVEIEGGKTPIDRRRGIELVTLLALHPRGLTEGQIKAALWMDEEPSTNAFNKTVSRARVALGLDSGGQPHIRYVEDCLYKPGPELVTDWSILEAAWISASRSPTPDRLGVLGEALQLVRGLPFEGTKGYEWAYEKGLPSRIEAIVDEATALITRQQSERAAG